MKIAVLTETYPSKDDLYSFQYVHTRNLAYKRAGHDVVVFSFNAPAAYEFETVTVKPAKDLVTCTDFNPLVVHAPNLRHHIPLITKCERQFKHMVWFLHGHEVLIKSKYYPIPFAHDRSALYPLKALMHEVYDNFKCHFLKQYITKRLGRHLSIVFVSNWMKQAFIDNIRVSESELDRSTQVIPNAVNQRFVENSFQFDCTKLGDFVTIRPFDNPKYGVDIVNRVAALNPQCSFHLYGKGHYFHHSPKANNLTLHEEYLSHESLAQTLNQYRAAFMPTRLDSQGVMMCEIATFGMPMVTSDLPICREMLLGFPNVEYIDNVSAVFDARSFLASIDNKSTPDKKRFAEDTTIGKELALFNSLIV